jgi:homoserine O-succinyltransferase
MGAEKLKMLEVTQKSHSLIRATRKSASRPGRGHDGHERRQRAIRIGLVNNMPDAALEDTELQFCDLLEAARGDQAVQVSLFSLPEVPRGARGKRRVAEFYADIEELWSSQFDALIVTGTEPRQPNMKEEPYWQTFTKIIDWAEENTASTVLSCLAAHAGVLYRDGISRHRLADKQFGVFEYRTGEHALTNGAASKIRIPHSRWNEVREDALVAHGYKVLTSCAEAGADLFVKKRGQCLFVHFQGHPEYGARTLLKEYRRDIKRYIRGERETYPTMPKDYFDANATQLLAKFAEKVLAHRHETLIREFPEAAVAESLEHSWRASAVRLYGNWLRYIASQKSNAVERAPVARAGRA